MAPPNMAVDRVLLEICCGCAEDAIQAGIGGADRVELCSALFLGGLTPSAGSLGVLTQQPFGPEVMAMVRPRAAGFCYSQVEMEVMKRDAELLLAHGADGIVFGVLRADRTVDVERCQEIHKIAAGRQTVFHRAFDVVPDPIRALEELINLGFTRVLTSGQQASAPQGSKLIRELVDHARGRIEILPGAGIREDNVRQLLAETGCSQVHATAFRQLDDPSTEGSPIQFGSTENPSESAYNRTDAGLVQRMRQVLDAL
jgi:copper homeostasis protein